MSLTLDDAERLQECLRGDGVALIPTDTVYGLACNPESQAAVRRIYELKGRPAAKPAAVMFFAREQALESLSELGPRTQTALSALLPGPVTLLLENPNRRFSLACDPGVGLLGLRVPLFEGQLAALGGVGVPAAQSSANLSGGVDPRDLRSVPIELREGVDLVLDGGELPGVASTVIDLSEYEHSGRWRTVRAGPLDARFIRTALAGSC
ncbi:MAG TPA: L-threonylcarbamoyladenylate synthase [Solirubrobacteraceae bacterium]